MFSHQPIPHLKSAPANFYFRLSSRNPIPTGELRLWLAAFRRFYYASNLHQQPIATQQGYLLQASGPVIARTIGMPDMPWNVRLRTRWLHRYAGSRIQVFVSHL